MINDTRHNDIQLNTFSTLTLSRYAFSILTVIILEFCILTNITMAHRKNGIQHIYIQHNGI
jgi:hypothetical protein